MHLVCPVVQAFETALIVRRENVEDATAVLATVNLSLKEKSSSFTHTVETGKMKSEGKDM